MVTLASAGCTGGDDSAGAGDLRAQRVVLEREVEGLRAIVQRLERGQPLLPADDIAIAIDEAFVRDLVLAQSPLRRRRRSLPRAAGSPTSTCSSAAARPFSSTAVSRCAIDPT